MTPFEEKHGMTEYEYFTKDFDERALSLVKKFGHQYLEQYENQRKEIYKRMYNPSTLEEMEWVVTVRKYNWLTELRKCRDEIEKLETEGWTNHGWFNNSVVNQLLPDEYISGVPGLRKKAREYYDKNIPHKIIGFLFGTDDVRCFVLTPPSDYVEESQT